MPRIVIVALALLLIFSLRLQGQVDSTGVKVLRGVIVDDSLGHALPFVHLWTTNSNTGGISNDSGEFEITVSDQDSLVFSALGYYSDSIIVPDSSLNQKLAIRLKRKRYELAEVVVRRFGTYESFKQQVLNLRLPKTQTDYLREHLKVSATTAAVEADRERVAKDKVKGFGVTSSLGPGRNAYREGLKKISNLKQREKIIHEKFNRQLVADLTQLEGDSLSRFIAYCNFSEDYLYESDLYAIVEALTYKFDSYQAMRDSIPD